MCDPTPVLLGQRFEDALVYSFRLHRKQTRKGNNIPYISHLLAVAGIILEYGGSEDQAIAALLHDAVEDQGGEPTAKEIQERFGKDVAQMVMDCSDTDQTPKPPWQQRKEDYLEHLPGLSETSRLISAADKLHNVRTLLQDYRRVGEELWGRFTGNRSGSLWYYRSLANIFLNVGPVEIAQELDRAVKELETLAKVNEPA